MSAGLRIAVLIKQVPLIEGGNVQLELSDDGRLIRDGIDVEINPFCRRAISKGVELAGQTGGECVVFTLGPKGAEDALREAIAAGATRAVLISDPVFAGSDTLATARALAAALEKEGSFDLVLSGLNSVDAETGQVGPQIAELVDLPFVSGVRELEFVDGRFVLDCERDDGRIRAFVAPPVIMAVTERLIFPAKRTREERAAVDPNLIVTIGAADLGEGPWGQAGSPTWVGDVRLVSHERLGRRLEGSLDEQLDELVEILKLRTSFTDDEESTDGEVVMTTGEMSTVLVALEPGRDRFSRELLGGAAALAGALNGSVLAVTITDVPDLDLLGSYGADQVISLHSDSPIGPEDVATAFVAIAEAQRPLVVIAPSSSWGREVGSRFAAATGSGLTGDASSLEIVEGRLLAWKPAFGGQLEASIVATSAVQCATVRSGAFSLLTPRAKTASFVARKISTRGRIIYGDHRRDSSSELIASASVLVSVGVGVPPERYGEIEPLVELLGAELVGTRKVTDRGWLPRTRQVGITALHVRPSLCVVIGAAGKFNHMIGMRSADMVIGINIDEKAPIFDACDIGIIADWADVVPLLTERLRDVLAIGA